MTEPFATLESSPHLSPEAWRQAYAAGLPSDDRIRALHHLSLRCGACLAAAEALGGPLPEPVALPDRPEHLVSLAVRQWLRFRSQERPVGRPALVYWSRIHRWCELGFARLALEVAHDLTLERPPSAAVPWSRGALELLEELPAEAPAAVLCRLRALTLARLAEVLRRSGELDQAELRLLDAEDLLDHAAALPDAGWIHDEIRATVFELRFQLDFDQRRSPSALRFLERAVDLVRGRVEQQMPGRLAEPLVALGSARLLLRDPRAAATLQEALEVAPAGRNEPLELVALHSLAMDSYQSGALARAWSYLETASALYTRHATPEIEAQRQWLRGALHLAEGRPAESVAPLRDALERFRALGETLPAVHTLANLARAHFEAGQPEELFRIEKASRDLLSTPEALALAERSLGEAVEAARKAGHEAPQLKALLDRLAARARRRSH